MKRSRTTYLDAEARLGGAFLHPGGRLATDLLLDFIAPGADDTILELGCGPGTTTELVAKRPGVSVVAIDASTAMLHTARKRIERAGLAEPVRFGRHDLNLPLPFPDASFEAVCAESVIALLDPEPVLREAARVLRSGGKLALNERIWRSGISQEQVDLTNAGSLEAFGIPAATPAPLDRDRWIEILERLGLHVDDVIAVADLQPPANGPSVLRSRIERYRHYVLRPDLAWNQLQFKLALRQRRPSFDTLESYLFFAHKPR